MFAAGIDSMVPAFAREGIWLFVFLFVVVFFRAQATYWLARGAARVSSAPSHAGLMAPSLARVLPCSTSGASSSFPCAS